MYEYEDKKPEKKITKKVINTQVEATIQKAEVSKKVEKKSDAIPKLLVAIDNLVYVLKGNGFVSPELTFVIDEVKKVRSELGM
jgi:hypothetical protein